MANTSAAVERTVSRTMPVVAAGLIAAYFTAGQGHPLVLSSIYLGLGFSVVVAICLGVHWRQPSAKGPWLLAAGAFACLWLGDAYYFYAAHFSHAVTPYPSMAEVAHLVGYALLAASLVAFVRRRVPTRDTTALIDTLLIGCAGGLFAWLLFVDDYLADETLSASALATALGFPIFDVIAMALLARLVFTGGARTTPVGLLVLSTCGWIVADTVYAVQATAGTYVDGSIVDLGWIGGHLLWIIAALHPRMARLTDAVDEAQATLSRRRLVMLATASLLAPAVLIVKSWRGDVDNLMVIGSAAAAMFVLVVFRLAGLAKALGAAALRDPLTQLLNRTALMVELNRARHDIGRGDSTHVAVLFIDLDGFKLVNDTMGHNAGDAVLMTVARRLEREVRAGDIVARLGGDEFVVVCSSVAGAADAMAMADRIERALAQPLVIDGVRTMVTASIGVAIAASSSADPERLVQDADAAMYRVKRRPLSAINMPDARIRSVLSEEALIADIARGLRANEFVPYYQPIVDLDSTGIVGVEMLARWRHPDLGLLLPESFLDIADQSGLIVEIGDGLLRQALADIHGLRRALGAHIRLFVNLGGCQLQQLDLASGIATALAAAKIEPAALVVELHESISMSAIGAAPDLAGLVDLGVQVWLDDVGAGHRTVLEAAPVCVDGLKIDRQFACGNVDTAAVAGVLAIAHARGQQVIAEGVETAEDRSTLRRLGVRYGQGFHLGVPAPAGELAAQFDEDAALLVS